MSRQVVTIGTSDSCLEAVRMHRARVRHLPVVIRSVVEAEIGRMREFRSELIRGAYSIC
jgi:CBS-domain-containing membrane protein